MPIRAFVYDTVEDLIKKVGALDKARQGGSIELISAAGVTTKKGAVNQRELETRYYQARFEIYAFGQGLYGKKQNAQCAILEPQNPWREKGMKVHARSSVGVFGYPLPAPLVPPNP